MQKQDESGLFSLLSNILKLSAPTSFFYLPTSEVKHLLSVSLYKGYLFPIVPLSPLSGEVLTMFYNKGSIDAGTVEFDISTKKYKSVTTLRLFNNSSSFYLVMYAWFLLDEGVGG